MLHDWRLGEAYFMQNLIDGDFSSNNGGWQWSSSTAQMQLLILEYLIQLPSQQILIKMGNS